MSDRICTRGGQEQAGRDPPAEALVPAERRGRNLCVFVFPATRARSEEDRPMIVVMSPSATKAQVTAVRRTVEAHGLQAFVSVGQERTVVGVVGTHVEQVANIGSLHRVEQV